MLLVWIYMLLSRIYWLLSWSYMLLSWSYELLIWIYLLLGGSYRLPRQKHEVRSGADAFAAGSGSSSAWVLQYRAGTAFSV